MLPENLTALSKKSKKDRNKLFFQVNTTEWMFDFPTEYSIQFNRLFDLDSMDLSFQQHTQELQNIINQCPYVLDAYRELAEIVDEHEDKQDSCDQAVKIYDQAFIQAQILIPAEFDPNKHTIPSKYIENLPYLRLINSYAEFLSDHKKNNKAQEYFSLLTKLDPNSEHDNNQEDNMDNFLATNFMELLEALLAEQPKITKQKKQSNPIKKTISKK